MEKIKTITAMLTCSCLSLYAQSAVSPSWQETPVFKPRQKNEGKEKNLMAPPATSFPKTSFCT